MAAPRALAALALAALTIAPRAPLLAQQAEPTRIVLLPIPGDEAATLLVGAKLRESGRVTLFSRRWIAERAEERGVTSAELAASRDDLDAFMRAIDIALIVRSSLLDDGALGVEILDPLAPAPIQFRVALEPDKSLSEQAATRIALRVLARLPEPVAAEAAPIKAAAGDPGRAEPDAAEAQGEGEERARSDRARSVRLGAWLGAGRRDLLVGSSQGRVLSTSGSLRAALGLEAYLFAENFSDSAAARPLFARIEFGAILDRLGVVGAEGELASLSLRHSVASLSAGYDLARLLDPGEARLAARLSVAYRYAGLSVEENELIPSYSLGSLGVDAELRAPTSLAKLALLGRASWDPIVFWGGSSSFFGESASGERYGGALGAEYEVRPGAAVGARARFALYRSSFTGQGESEVMDARGEASRFSEARAADSLFILALHGSYAF